MSSTAIGAAANHRREVFAAVASSDSTQGAVEAISRLLSVSTEDAQAVLAAPLESFAGLASESSGQADQGGLGLYPFRDSEDHKDLFHSRSSDETSATGGEWDAHTTEQERKAGLGRIETESAMWFVAVDTARDHFVGLVFGEQVDDGDVDVAIWVRPEERKKGFGLEALKECRRELAAFFPGKNVIVRAPLPGSK